MQWCAVSNRHVSCESFSIMSCWFLHCYWHQSLLTCSGDGRSTWYSLVTDSQVPTWISIETTVSCWSFHMPRIHTRQWQTKYIVTTSFYPVIWWEVFHVFLFTASDSVIKAVVSHPTDLALIAAVSHLCDSLVASRRSSGQNWKWKSHRTQCTCGQVQTRQLGNCTTLKGIFSCYFTNEQ